MIDYLIVYALGIATPIVFKIFVLPKLKKRLKEKAANWK